MYVMLVDDEVRICNGLARLLTRRWPDLEVACLDNAIDALDAINARRPNLLITDICMPEMDGLTLIERASKLGVSHCVILTGYDEFSFAQRALKLHTLDYLLKPVEAEQLYSLVEKCMEIKRETEEAEYRNLCSQLRLRLQYNVNSTDLSESFSDVELFQPSRWLLLALLSAAQYSDEATVLVEMPELLHLAERHYALGQDSSGHWMVLCLFSPDGRVEMEQRALLLRKRHTLAGYCIAPANLDGLHAVYLSALQSIETGLEKAALLWQTGGYDSLCALLDNHLLQGEGLEERLKVAWYFLGTIKRNQDVWTAAELFADYPRKNSSQRLAMLKNWLDELKKAPQPVTGQIILAVDRIAQGYRQELNLSQLARELYMTPSHFCTMFHQETGYTFVDYMNRVRINQACLYMMSDHDASQESIAETVGFSNAPYFFRVFKKYTGMTPGAFRQMIQSV